MESNMPKVSQSYISKTGFSQGKIYRYYSSVDKIFLNAINQATPSNQQVIN